MVTLLDPEDLNQVLKVFDALVQKKKLVFLEKKHPKKAKEQTGIENPICRIIPYEGKYKDRYS